MHKKNRTWPLRLWIVFLLACLFYEPVFYFFQLGKGQISILWNTESIDKILHSHSESDSVKKNLMLIREIYAFGTKQLGLSDKGAYQNYYDQKGKPVLWVLTVCKPYSIEPETWTFPIAGTVSYKGYFNKHSGLVEMTRWKSMGYDASLEEVYAWSTLGWFKDPVLSEMLHKHPGELANTLLHEMTHATIYKSGDIEFNENIASFVGDKGAEAFLIAKYGKDSEWLITYRELVKRRKDYSEIVLRQAIELDQLYKSARNIDAKSKLSFKKAFMMKALNELNTFRKIPLLASDLNNCYYADVNRYRNKQDIFDRLLQKNYSGQLRAFIEFYKK